MNIILASRNCFVAVLLASYLMLSQGGAVLAQVMAISGSAPLAGNQDFAGPLGIDFVVVSPIEITALGVYDASQDGIASSLDVAIWQRNTNGTPNDFTDDTGVQILSQLNFNSGDQGNLNNVFRTKDLFTPLVLAPGSYTVSAGGFTAADPVGNTGVSAIPLPTTNNSGGLINFVGTSRYYFGANLGQIAEFPIFVDGGPAARYYAGTFVYQTPIFDPVLSVSIDRDSGQVKLKNGTASTQTLIGYEITSSIGALHSDNWTSIADHYDVNGDKSVDLDDAWTRLTANGSLDDLSEFQFDGNGGTLALSQEVDLGNSVWIANSQESDIQFSYVLSGDPTIHQGAVRFTGNNSMPFPFGDLNFDGAAFQLDDFTDVLLSQLESDHTSLSVAQAYQVGDLNGDLIVDEADFRIFKNAYVSGGGSLAALKAAIAGVPEPSTYWLALLGSFAVFVKKTSLHRFRRAAVLAALVCVITSARSTSAQTVALESTPPMSGNQGDYDGTLGMDFDVVEFPIQVSAIGVFDSDQDGVQAQSLFAEIWNRNNGGTPNDPLDDTGTSVVSGLSATFAPGDDGTLLGGSRFKNVGSVTLNPGSYTIAAGNFFESDPLLNIGYSGSPPTINDGGGVVKFVGASRFGGTNAPGSFPQFADAGPANRYHAGTFQFALAVDPMVLEVNRATGVATIRNSSSTSTTFDIDYYRITSDMGSLDPDWAGLGGDWSAGGAGDDTVLVEANLTGSTMFTPGMTASLGHAYDTTKDKQDLTFTYYTPSGVEIVGAVQYISALVGDYNNDQVVDAADYVLWRDKVGSTAMLSNDPIGGTIGANQYAQWRANFGSTLSPGSGSAVSATVPEPDLAALLVLPAFAALLVAMRRKGDSLVTKRQTCFARFGIVGLIVVAIATPAWATKTNDRDYQFGDHPDEDASDSIGVGTGPSSAFPGYTFDGAGFGGGDFQDLQAFGPGGFPTYADTSSRPGAGPTELGIHFDGVDDYLLGYRLGLPSTSEAAFGGIDGLAPLDYSGLSNRGYQLWVRPERVDILQSVVMDTNQHGLQITADGKWSMRYAGLNHKSNLAVAIDTWTHVMVVRPFGAARGSWLYVNGVAVAAAPGEYIVSDDRPLVVGANTDSSAMVTDAGTKDFFQGTLDNIEMFVLGTSTNTMTSYGVFNPGTDNAFIASALAGFAPGDVNLDTSVDSGDVNFFMSRWHYTREVNGLRVGDLIGRQNGDLNYDGIVDLADAIILNQALLASGNGGLDFAALGAEVPEPPSAVLAAFGLAVGLATTYRRKI